MNVFEAIRYELPNLRLLGLYDLPNLQCRWLYDFQSDEFLGATRQKAFKPLIALKDLSDFEYQLTTTSQSLEYILSREGVVISCLSERDKTNARLLEIAIQRHGDTLIALPVPSRKGKVKAPSAKSAAARSSDGKLSPAEIKAVLTSMPGYEPIKALSADPLLPSFKLRHKASGELKVLKCLTLRPELFAAAMADIRQTTGLHDFEDFEAPELFAGRALLRPYCEGVSLKALLQKVTTLSVQQTIYIVIELCQALEKLHRLNRAHLSLSPNNVLINRDKQVQLVDRWIGELRRPLLGSAQAENRLWLMENRFYLAPDYFEGSSSPAVDLFALGALSLHMLMGTEAFMQKLEGTERDRQPEVLVSLIDILVESGYPIFRGILRQMLDEKPEQRPDPQIIVSSLLTEIKNKSPVLN